MASGSDCRMLPEWNLLLGEFSGTLASDRYTPLVLLLQNHVVRGAGRALSLHVWLVSSPL